MKNVKAILALALAGALSVSCLAACGKQGESTTTSATEAVTTEATVAKVYDLADVFKGILDKQGADKSEELEQRLRETDNMDKIGGLYVGIGDIDLAQVKLYAPPISGNACEVILVEAKNDADVKAVQDVLQARIDSAINGGACDEEMGAVWKNNSKIYTSGNYVAMVVLPNGYTIPENIFE